MSKKDFELIASIIKQNSIYFDNDDSYYFFCRGISELLAEKYPRFDIIKFIKATQ